MDTLISADESIVKIIQGTSLDKLKSLKTNGEVSTYLQSVLQSEDVSHNDYKCSTYNCHAESNGIHLIYNTLYNTLVKMDDKEYLNFIKAETSNPAKVDYLKNGLWVGNNAEEYRKYLALANLMTVVSSNHINLTVTTTMKCNARCKYCYENGVVRKDFNEEYLSGVVDFIKEQTKNAYVNLCWFGGEPLLNTKIIDRITEKLNKENISYGSYIITNGSLIDDEMVEEKFSAWNVHDVQVSFDGTIAMYEKVKNYIDKSEGIYYKILYQLAKLAEKKIYVNIRMNISPENYHNILLLVEELELALGKYDNVVFYPAFITGEKNKFTEEEKYMVVYELLKKLKNPQKLTSSSKFYSTPRIHACMKEDPNSFVIDVDGFIYACEHYVGRSENAIGDLKVGLYNDDDRFKQNVLRDECRNCLYLPKCMGGCASSYTGGDSACMIDKYIINAYMKYLME